MTLVGKRGAFGLIRIGYCSVTDKIAYGGKIGADRERAALALRDARVDVLQSYKCRYCDAWHVGHALRAAR